MNRRILYPYLVEGAAARVVVAALAAFAWVIAGLFIDWPFAAPAWVAPLAALALAVSVPTMLLAGVLREQRQEEADQAGGAR